VKNKIKLYLDEDVHPEAAFILKKMGFDAVSTLERNKCGASDKAQLEYATRHI